MAGAVGGLLSGPIVDRLNQGFVRSFLEMSLIIVLVVTGRTGSWHGRPGCPSPIPGAKLSSVLVVTGRRAFQFI
jgi:hypothetical protein